MATYFIAVETLLSIQDFVDVASNEDVDRSTGADILALSQSVSYEVVHPTPAPENNDLEHHLISNLNLTQIVKTPLLPLKLTSQLYLQQDMYRRHDIDLFNTLMLTHWTEKLNLYELSNTLNLSQTVRHNGNDGENTLVFTNTATYQFVRNRTFSQTLSLSQTVTVFKANDPNYVAINVTTPTAGDVVFSYGVLSVTLPAPEFGDTDSIEQSRINRRSRGLDLIIYRDSIWSRRDIFRWTFSGLSESEAFAFQNFINQTVGLLVDITDFYGRSWQGTILNPDLTIEHAGLGCQYSFAVEFET
jgi:hypothetical protein